MTDFESLRAKLLSKAAATEEQPFGPDAWVYKVMGKVFAIASANSHPVVVSLKCDPDEALALRGQYAAVAPGYHLNKKHWNTVNLDGTIPAADIDYMIEQSYRLVVKGLKKADRDQLSYS